MDVMRQLLRVMMAAAGAVAITVSGVQAGEITAYTSLEEDDARVYLDAFKKAEPNIKVNILRLSTGDLGARILAEAANPRHDVIWGWAATQMVDPRVLQLLEPYEPKGFQNVNERFKDKDKRWFATTGYFGAFCVNNEIAKKKNLPDSEILARPNGPDLQGADRHAQPSQFRHRIPAYCRSFAEQGRRAGLEIH